MTGKVNDGQLCTVEPPREHGIEVGDIVLCRVNGSQYLHLVKAFQGERFQIGDPPADLRQVDRGCDLVSRQLRIPPSPSVMIARVTIAKPEVADQRVSVDADQELSALDHADRVGGAAGGGSRKRTAM